MNFGGFATPERNLVFDVNDFDETLPAPFEWDLKRLATSFVIAARWRGYSPKQAREMAVVAVSSYRRSMRKRADIGVLETWYSMTTLEHVREVVGSDKDLRSLYDKKIAEAHKETQEHVAHKITTPSKGLPCVIDQPPLLYHDDKQLVNEHTVATFLKQYRETLSEDRRALFDRFKAVDAAMKVVGVGSVGTRCYVVLLLATPNDPLFLQVKEARPSVFEPYTRRTPVENNGHRVVTGQRLMQSSSDIFLGWAKGPQGRAFYVRQLRDMKCSADLESDTPREMWVYATLCGHVLARAH
jgi:uncharacterized protein (DUF2252 family)